MPTVVLDTETTYVSKSELQDYINRMEDLRQDFGTLAATIGWAMMSEYSIKYAALELSAGLIATAATIGWTAAQVVQYIEDSADINTVKSILNDINWGRGTKMKVVTRLEKWVSSSGNSEGGPYFKTYFYLA